MFPIMIRIVYYTTIHVRKNSSNCNLKLSNIIVCKFQFKMADVKLNKWIITLKTNSFSEYILPTDLQRMLKSVFKTKRSPRKHTYRNKKSPENGTILFLLNLSMRVNSRCLATSLHSSFLINTLTTQAGDLTNDKKSFTLKSSSFINNKESMC